MKRLISLALLAVTACSTTMLSTWKKPGVHQLEFQKVAVVAVVKDAAVRRTIEDQLVSELGRSRAVASYTFAPGDLERESLKAGATASGADGVIAVRIVDTRRESHYTSTGYGYSYGFGGWPMYDSGYVTTNTYVSVETNIYSLPEAELLFSATSETINPSSTRKLIDETVEAVRSELKKEGIITDRVAAR